MRRASVRLRGLAIASATALGFALAGAGVLAALERAGVSQPPTGLDVSAIVEERLAQAAREDPHHARASSCSAIRRACPCRTASRPSSPPARAPARGAAPAAAPDGPQRRRAALVHRDRRLGPGGRLARAGSRRSGRARCGALARGAHRIARPPPRVPRLRNARAPRGRAPGHPVLAVLRALVASLLFYALWIPVYLLLLLEIAVNYALLRGMLRSPRPRLWLTASIVLSLGLLAVFK